MNRQEAIQKLKDANNHDTEVAHGIADSVLAELLISLGYEDVVDAYHEVDKWYA